MHAATDLFEFLNDPFTGSLSADNDDGFIPRADGIAVIPGQVTVE
jgi:hypothetical protein